MTLDLLLALLAFSFVSSITPGPNNLMLLASGTNFGLRRTLPHMFGVTLGFVLMVTLVGTGLIQLFERFPVIGQVLKVASLLYLVFLAWNIATAAGPASAAAPAGNQSSSSAKPFSFVQAALFQWVNPKAWTMALTAITTYTPQIPDSSGGRPLMSILWVAFAFGAVNFPSITVWVVLGTQIRRFLNDPLKLRIFNGLAALLLLGSLYPIIVS